MNTSSAGVALIKRNEGCKLAAYQDMTGVWTIGYGDTLGVHPGMTITQQQAEENLSRRLNEFEPAVWKACGNKATQPQFDAMVSLAWNIGVGGFARSSVARLHREGNYAAAADAFRLWNKAGGKIVSGLVRRREEERALYLSASTAEVDADTVLPPPTVDLDLLADAVRIAQRAVGAEPDGILGPLSIAAIQAAQRGR